MPKQRLSTFIGKTIKYLMRLRGGGSALPGLVVEKIDPGYLKRTLEQLPMGVVVISGTNGKTTTTKIVSELLESAGLKVITNKTGSNFSRGIIAALLDYVDCQGRLDASIAVLELDEAWAVRFIEQVKPRYSLLLNVSEDQVDRFGGADTTAKMLEKIAFATTNTIVLNRDDPRLSMIGDKLKSVKTVFFGASKPILNDRSMEYDNKSSPTRVADVELVSIEKSKITLRFDGHDYTAAPALSGIHNFLNITAAVSLVRQILDASQDMDKIVSTIPTIQPAFGRGETLDINNQSLKLSLVKNLASFQATIDNLPERSKRTMLVINNHYADGKDISWLKKADFSNLQSVDVVSGICADEATNYLEERGVSIGRTISKPSEALDFFLRNESSDQKQLLCSYTAMIEVRKLLSKYTSLKKID